MKTKLFRCIRGTLFVLAAFTSLLCGCATAAASQERPVSAPAGAAPADAAGPAEGAAPAPAASSPLRFVQDRFLISFWVDPPADAKMDQYYADIAAANFTVVLGGFGARSGEEIRRQLDLCERHGMKAIVRLPKNPERFRDHPALWGFSIKDEPNTSEFAGLRATVEELRATCPRKLAYINLLPTYATNGQLGASSYAEYVKRFLDEVDADLLCMDHYPMMTTEADGREGYCTNLEALRVEALKRGMPFWNFFNTMPYGPQWDPTEAQLRWQVYTSLAYGAKGVLYFCYWTPQGGEFPKGGAIVTPEGRKTRHYGHAQRINAVVKNWGPTLMQLTSESVVRVPRGNDPAEALKNSPIQSITPGDYLVGLFKHSDGRRAVMLNNYDFTYTAWPTVAFDVEDAQVIEIDPQTGEEVAAIDDSHDMPGLQLSLDSGEGRLFLLPAKAEVPAPTPAPGQ